MATPLPAVDTNAGIVRFSVAYFLAALVLLYVTAPFIQGMQNGVLIESVLMTLVLLSAVLAVSGRRGVLIWAIVFAIPALAEKWVNYGWPELLHPQASLWTGLVFISFIVLRLLNFILKAPQVNSDILCAGVATYLLLGLLWAFAYRLVDRSVPDSFAYTVGPFASHSLQGFNSLYFSITTLATSSYGGILPVSGLARMLAMSESMVGLLYVALLISRLVALYSTPNFSGDANPALESNRDSTEGAGEPMKPLPVSPNDSDEKSLPGEG